jgi:PAS domain S-box-containing protein
MTENFFFRFIPKKFAGDSHLRSDCHLVDRYLYQGSTTNRGRAFLILILLLLCLGLAGWNGIPHPGQVIRVGVYENPPKIFTAYDGTPAGFWPDLLAYIAAEEGWEIQWVYGTWDELLAKLANNEIDILPDTGWTEERSQKFAFNTETVLTSWSRLYAPEGSQIETLLDLDGKTIAGLESSVNLDGPEGIMDLANRFDLQIKFIEIDSYIQVFEALERGEIDAGVTNKDFGDLNEHKYAVTRTSIIFQPVQIMFAFTKEAELTPSLIETIDSRMKVLKTDPESVYYQALDYYFGEKNPPVIEVFPTWVKNALIIAGGAIFYLLTLGIVSRFQVRARTRQLRRSEEIFRSVVEQAGDGFSLTDENGKVILWNLSQATITGLDAAEILGLPAWDMYLWLEPEQNRTPDQLEIWRESMQKALVTGDLPHIGEIMERQYLHPDGSVRYLQGSIFSIKIGKRYMLGSQTRDVTASHELGAELERQREFALQVLEHMGEGLTVTDSDGRFEYVNPVYSHLLGYSPEDLIGRRPRDFTVPEDHAILDDVHRKRLSGKTNQYEARLRHKDGQIIPVLITGVPLLREGHVVGSIATIADLTERRAIELAVQKERDKAQQYLDIAGVIFLVINADGFVELINERGASILGYPQAEIIGKNWVDHFLPEDIRDGVRHVFELLVNGQTELVEYYENPVLTRSGEQRIIAWHNSLLKDENEKIIGILSSGEDITEKKKGEELLRESEERFRLAFDGANTGMCLFNPDGSFIQVNGAMSQIFGYAQEAFYKMTVNDLAHPEDLEILQNFIERAMSGEARHATFEKRCFHQQGSLVWVQVACSLVRDYGGAPLYFISQVQDITDRKQAEAALRESRERYREIINGMNDTVWVIGFDGKFVDVNERAIEIFGYSREELLSMGPTDIDSQLTEEQIKDLTQRMSSDEVQVFESQHFTKSGRAIPVEISSSLVTYQGRRAILSIARDITKRKQVEIEHREHHARLDAIMESTDSPIFSVDREYRYTSFNRAHAASMKELFGADIEIGANRLDCITDEAYRAEAKKSIEQALGGEAHIYLFSQRKKGPDRRFFEATYNPIMGDEAAPIGVSVFMSDVTARQQAEQAQEKHAAILEAEVQARTRELQDAQEKLLRQEKLAVLGELAGSVGHELRNPLTVMRNAVHFLKLTQPDADGKTKEYLGILDSEIRNSDKIIADLLDFSRIKSVDRQPLVVAAVVQRVLERFPVPAEIEVKLDFAPDLPSVFVDPHHIEQVLGNLVVNAYQAMTSPVSPPMSGGTEGGVLTISAQGDETQVKVFISDTGVGIPPENLEKIFEPLFTTKAKGIGLGLAVSQKLVEANGGKIEMESEVGIGTTFTLSLPCAAPAQNGGKR